jgi:hypothetical protein
VYKFCVQGIYDDEVIIRRSANANGPIRFLVRDPTGSHSYRWIDDPVNTIIDESKLGQLIAEEMLEAYFWTRRFKLSSRELALLDEVLATDLFGLGMTPACYIRHLNIQVQIGSAACSKTSGSVYSEEDDSLRAIQKLAVVLTPRTEVTLDIGLLGTMDDNIEFSMSSSITETLLENLAPVINPLKKRRLRVTVTHEKLWNDWR